MVLQVRKDILGGRQACGWARGLHLPSLFTQAGNNSANTKGDRKTCRAALLLLITACTTRLASAALRARSLARSLSILLLSCSLY
jgi:hypothetical protein